LQTNENLSQIKPNKQDNLSRWEFLYQINKDRCQYQPIYGCDVLSQIELVMNLCHRKTSNGYVLCQQINKISTTTHDYFTKTDRLRKLIQLNQNLFNEINQ
jgi:hypothetical protein